MTTIAVPAVPEDPAASPASLTHLTDPTVAAQWWSSLAHMLIADAGLEPARRVHTVMVGRRMQGLAHRAGHQPRAVDLYAAAGTLHDIGYAFPDTGHHAIDGARWLHTHGLPAPLVSLVAHHSTAAYEAAELGLSAALAEFALPDTWGAAALWVADFTTSPTGRPATLDDRVAEIRGRYRPDTPVIRALDAAAADMDAAFALVRSRDRVASRASVAP